MKINAAAGFNQYKKYVQGLKNNDVDAATTGKAKASGGAAPANTDKVTFSEAAAAQAEISRLTSAVSAEVEEVGSDARLAELSEKVAKGNYFVDSDALVSSILGRA